MKIQTRAVGTLIGTVVGVGIFGLPQVFAQAGFMVGAIELLALTIMTVILTLMYAEIIAVTPGKHRFVTYISRNLGEFGKLIAGMVTTVSVIGALLAFTIIGGDFLSALTGGTLTPLLASLVVWLLAGVLASGGLRVVSRLVVWVVIILLVLYAVLMASALPAFQLEHLLTISTNPADALLPYGVILFSLGGLSAIPEMHDLLGSSKRRLRRAIILGYAVIFLLYLAFVVTVVGASGSLTSAEALQGLAPHIGSTMLLVGAVLGLISVTSIFTVLGMETINLFRIDFGWSAHLAWLITFGVPLTLFLLGAREFISVIGFVGSLLNATIGLLIVIAFERLKKTTSKKSFWRIPTLLSFVIVLTLGLGMLMKIVYTFA